ncbi:MAG: hypothetical protein AABX39_04800, partial [Nanoarchaeota archaeon]
SGISLDIYWATAYFYKKKNSSNFDFTYQEFYINAASIFSESFLIYSSINIQSGSPFLSMGNLILTFTKCFNLNCFLKSKLIDLLKTEAKNNSKKN